MVRLFGRQKRSRDSGGFDEKTRMMGQLTVRLFDERGRLKHEQTVRNSVTQFQRDHTFYLIASQVPAQAGGCWFAVGTSNTAAATTDTALYGEVGSRIAGTFSHQAGLATYGMLATFPANNPATAYTLYEAGIFATSTSNTATAYYRATYAAVTKATSDSLQLIWTITETIS